MDSSFDLGVLIDHWSKRKENEKIDKYLHHGTWKVTVIPIAIGVLGTIPKGLVKRLEYFEIRKQEETTD